MKIIEGTENVTGSPISWRAVIYAIGDVHFSLRSKKSLLRSGELGTGTGDDEKLAGRCSGDVIRSIQIRGRSMTKKIL